MPKQAKTDILHNIKQVADMAVNTMGIYTPQQMTELIDQHGEQITALVSELRKLQQKIQKLEATGKIPKAPHHDDWPNRSPFSVGEDSDEESDDYTSI